MLWRISDERLVEKDVGQFYKISLANAMKQQPLQNIDYPHSKQRLVLI